jgi:hypothetical protein
MNNANITTPTNAHATTEIGAITPFAVRKARVPAVSDRCSDHSDPIPR